MKTYRVLVLLALFVIATGVWRAAFEVMESNVQLKRLNEMVDAIRGMIPL